MSFSKFIQPIPGFDLWGYMFGKRERDGDPENHDDTHKKRKRPEREKRVNFKDSIWYKEYIIDSRQRYRDPQSPHGKLFRRRFALDREDVLEMSKRMVNENVWVKKIDRCGQDPIPVELLMLTSLRVLTRSWTFDCIRESTNISEKSARSFFYKFVCWYGTKVFDEVVRLPEVDDIESNGAEYARAGFPATIGSVDCVHVRLWLVSNNLKQFSTGKEGYPSIAFEVIVNHRREIIGVSLGFYGSVPDKNIVRFDDNIHAVRDKYNNYKTHIYSIFVFNTFSLICTRNR
jgi:hypothetical protein